MDKKTIFESAREILEGSSHFNHVNNMDDKDLDAAIESLKTAFSKWAKSSDCSKVSDITRAQKQLIEYIKYKLDF